MAQWLWTPAKLHWQKQSLFYQPVTVSITGNNFIERQNALGATEGARRVAVDDGFMPRDRQVGATGTWVSARVYIAVGISGAIQHLQGIAQCEKVIAINTDAGCDMVKRADLSVIDDSEKVLQALLSKWRSDDFILLPEIQSLLNDTEAQEDSSLK